jgi:type II secretory pathway predicted ATPase ExeA
MKRTAGREVATHPRLPERPVLRRRHHQIHDAARGNPRAVNNLAIAALIATYAATKKIVDQSAARAAISEVISAE